MLHAAMGRWSEGDSIGSTYHLYEEALAKMTVCCREACARNPVLVNWTSVEEPSKDRIYLI